MPAPALVSGAERTGRSDMDLLRRIPASLTQPELPPAEQSLLTDTLRAGKRSCRAIATKTARCN